MRLILIQFWRIHRRIYGYKPEKSRGLRQIFSLIITRERKNNIAEKGTYKNGEL